MQYHLKTTKTVEAITFEELVAIGIAQGVPLYDGVPWSFRLGDYPVTHESDDCYIVNHERFGRGAMLVNGGQGWTVLFREEFDATYEAMPPPAAGPSSSEIAGAALSLMNDPNFVNESPGNKTTRWEDDDPRYSDSPSALSSAEMDEAKKWAAGLVADGTLTKAQGKQILSSRCSVLGRDGKSYGLHFDPSKSNPPTK